MSQPEPRPQSQPQPPAQPKPQPRPERRASTQLTRRQRRGLLRLGDIVIPGDRDLPSFSRSGSADGIGLMLPHMYDADRSSLLALLTACAVLPKPLITLVVAAASRSGAYRATAPLRLANVGIKGVVHSLYWSDVTGAGIHEAIGYAATINERP